MTVHEKPVARQVPVESDEYFDIDEAYDYADAFEVRLATPDEHSAEQWMRAGLEQAFWPLRWVVLIAWRKLLRFRLASLSSRDHVLGWRVVSSRPNAIRLEATSPLVRGVLIGRKVGETRAVVTTLVSYERPVLGRVVWAIVGPLHRLLAPRLMVRAAATVQRVAVSH